MALFQKSALNKHLNNLDESKNEYGNKHKCIINILLF